MLRVSLLDEVVDKCVETLYRLETPSISKINFHKLLKLSTSGVQFTLTHRYIPNTME